MIADTRIAEIADLSIPELTDLLADLDTGALDMDITGFCADEIARLMEGPVVEYDAETPAVKPLRVSGEIPTDVWNMQSERLQRAMNSAAAEFGISLKWPK
jgi:hypothetical protein